MNRHIASGTEARVVAACGLFALAVSFHAGQAHAETVSETITVDSANPNPTTAHTHLLAGGVYTFTVSGTFAYGLGGQADAECTTLPPDSTWTRARFAAIDPNQDDLDLYVNDHNVDWQPATADPQRCDSRGHAYTLRETAGTTTSLTFRVYDDPTRYGTHKGALTVRITGTAPNPTTTTAANPSTTARTPVTARPASGPRPASPPAAPNVLVPSLALGGPPQSLPAPGVTTPAVAAPQPTTRARPDVELTRPGGFSSGAWWHLTAPQAVAVAIVGIGALSGVAAMARTRVAVVDTALRAVPAWLWRLRFGRRR